MQRGTVLLTLLYAASGCTTAMTLAPPAVADDVQYMFALPEKATQIEVIGGVSKGKFLRPPAAGDQETIRKYTQLLAKGKTFPAYAGGKPAGNATVESFDADSFCAKVKLDFKPTANCIVSNGKVNKHAAIAEPTAAVRTQALDAAVALFKQEHAKVPNDIKKIFSKVWGRDLDGDGKPEVIAYYFIPAVASAQKGIDDRPHAILLFAHTDKSGAKLIKERIHCEHVDKDDVPSPSKVGPGFYTHMPFDTFDVNGDGRDEIITAVQTMAGTWYHVWGVTEKGWQDLYSTYRYKEEI